MTANQLMVLAAHAKAAEECEDEALNLFSEEDGDYPNWALEAQQELIHDGLLETSQVKGLYNLSAKGEAMFEAVSSVKLEVRWRPVFEG